MQSMTNSEGLSLVLPAFMALTLMEKDRYPNIVEVGDIDSEIGDTMERLGYDELSPELYKAFIQTGAVDELAPGERKEINAKVVADFLRS